MLIFSLIAVLMLVIALAFALLPLLRTATATAAVSNASSNVSVYQSQRRELDAELTRGVMDQAEYDAALNELSIRLVDEIPEAPLPTAVPSSTSPRRWWLSALIVVVMPVSAILIYATLGAPRAIETAGSVAAAPERSVEEPPMSDKQIVAMVDALAKKMQEQPNDPRGWILLARSQTTLGRFAEASAAFERALALTPKDAQLLADFADASVMAQQGKFDGKPYALIKRALAVDPNHMKALALAGTAEHRLGNHTASLKHWQKLTTLVPKDSPDFRELESIIAEVKAAQAGTTPRSAPSTAPPPTVAVAPAPSADAPTSAAKVVGKVEIAPNLVGNLAPGDTLFVFARAKEGPRMPLAVMRVPAPSASAFPVAFELNDAMAMAPAFKLSSFAEVVVEARISKSGNAMLQSGDLSGVSGVVKPGSAAAITVTIGKIAP